MTKSRSLPQAAQDADPAMALVCTVPAANRGERRAGVQSVIASATSFRELEDGVAFCFDGSDELAHRLLELVLAERECCAQFRYALGFEPRQGTIELRIEAMGPLVQPLKDLYIACARNGDTSA